MTRWVQLGDLFGKIRKRFQSGLEESQVFEAFQNLAPQAKPIFFNKKTGELLVQVPNSILAQNLHFRAYQIINQINKQLGRKVLQRIRFRVG